MSATMIPPNATGHEVLIAALRQISDRIPGLRQQGMRISEEDTKRVLITPLLHALGWDIHDIAQLRNEYRHNVAHNPVDYALFLNERPVLFVEAKPLAQGLDDPRWVLQTLSYAHGAGVDWCALSNGAEWRIYKVLAEGEADQKLFAKVAIDPPAALDHTAKVLCLLSRDNMHGRAIDEIWQESHVDQKVQQTLELAIQDDALAKWISKRLPQLNIGDIRRSLSRANIGASFRPVASGLRGDLSPHVGALAKPLSGHAEAQQPSSIQIDPPSELRRRLQSTQELFELGRLKTGELLTIRGRNNSAARVVDGRTVEFQGTQMSFLAWGKQVTGWQAIQIYTWACLPDGRTLDMLRDQPASTSGAT